MIGAIVVTIDADDLEMFVNKIKPRKFYLIYKLIVKQNMNFVC